MLLYPYIWIISQVDIQSAAVLDLCSIYTPAGTTITTSRLSNIAVVPETTTLPLTVLPAPKKIADVAIAVSALTEEPHLVLAVLKIQYSFTCPLTGTHARRFGVGALYNRAAGEMTMQPHHNVDRFSEFLTDTPSPGEFHAIFVGEWQHSYKHICCSYNATGFIGGRVHGDDFQVRLAGLRSLPPQKPKVYQDCRTIRGRPIRSIEPCFITHVDSREE